MSFVENYIQLDKFNPRALIKREKDSIIINESDINLFDKPNYVYPNIEPFNELKSYEENLIAYLDIETTGLLPWKDEVKLIGIKYSDGEYWFSYGHDEAKILKEFLHKLCQKKVFALITHNGFKFDFPFLEERFRQHKIIFPFVKADKERTVTSSSFHGKPIQYYPYRFLSNSLHLIDTLVQCCIWDKTFNKLESYGLKNAVIELGLRKERRTELSYQEMLACYRNNNWELILEYLKFDLEDTELLANRIVRPYYYQMRWVPNVSFEYICIASPALKAQKQYEALVKNRNVISDTKLSFVGGISEVVNPGIYKNIAKIDVASLYPTLMLEYGLCSKKDKQMKMLGLLTKLKAERLRLKRLSDAASQVEQEALKILINGLFGYHGVGFYTFNDMECAALITAYGRAVLRLMERVIVASGAIVIELDTDGCYYASDTPEAVYEAVKSALPKGIEIELEIKNACGYIPKAKNYIIMYGKFNKKTQQVEEVLIKKGIYKKRNRIKLLNEFCVNLVRSFTSRGKESAKEYFTEVKSQLKNKEINIENLFITRKISTAEKTLVNLGIGNVGEKVSFLYKSEDKLHKTSGKKLGINYIPTISYEDYDPQYYIDEISKFYYEIFPEDVKVKKSLYVSF
jgi:DNA polymerase, archaea type